MAFLNFPTEPSPEWNVVDTTKAKVLKAGLGDGYSQRVPDGINSIMSKVDLKWNHLTEVERDIVKNFLEARKGAEAFLYTVPGHSVERKWTCEQWKCTFVDYDVYDMSASFEQVFDL